jgi:hypothetical protein
MSNFVDGSGPIFSMYLDVATEEDKKMAEGWKADADGILIFVSLSVISTIDTDVMGVDRSILCCSRVVDFGVNSGHSTKLTGHLQLLPREYLSGNC